MADLDIDNQHDFFKNVVLDENGAMKVVSSGASSVKNHGFFDYNDLATATTPISVTGGAGFTYLTNDALGTFTNKL